MTDPGTISLAVRVAGLTKFYDGVAAVDAVDLVVRDGEVRGLLGPNGAGKTTLLRMLLGLVAPDAGTVELHGVDAVREPRRALAEVAGFVEAPRFYPYLSVRANLQQLARLDAGRASADAIDDVLATVGLADRSGAKARELSFGMGQRLGIAAALMRGPRLLVLDEPFNGLDPAGIRDVRALVRRLADAGTTVLLSSHRMDDIEHTCDTASVLRRGSVVFDGSLADLRAQATTAERRLDTSDNPASATLAQMQPGVHDVRVDAADGRVRFEADDGTVEELCRALVGAGIGIRQLEAPSSPLESLFFRLTEQEGSAA